MDEETFCTAGRCTPSQMAQIQETAESLAALTRAEIASAWDRRAVRVAEELPLTDGDIKVLKELTNALKAVIGILRDVYAVPTIKEEIDLEKWEEEQRLKGGGSTDTAEYDVIILPPVRERREEEDAEDMDTTAQADRLSGATRV
ncbi:MAG: hypothetical protein Q4C06_04775 [Bacillota bacterium]|nr:hypothetical protein [Bacillota bacterium]